MYFSVIASHPFPQLLHTEFYHEDAKWQMQDSLTVISTPL